MLRPSQRFDEIFLGVLGRSQRLQGMEIVAVICLSTHFHLLLRPRDAQQLAAFAGHLKGNLARKVNRLVGWSGPVFGRRYDAIVVSDEPAAQIGRLRYLLSNSVKEDLVMSPTEWPGVQSATALVDGSMRLEGGLWFDGRKAHPARLRGEPVDCFDFPEPETVHLTKLPCWEHLDDATYRQRSADLVQEIEEEARGRHRRDGTAPAGARWVLRQDPLSCGKPLRRSPSPAFHAATREARRALEEAYRWFVVAYRAAAMRLRQGGDPHGFPDGAFPPAAAFVTA